LTCGLVHDLFGEFVGVAGSLAWAVTHGQNPAPMMRLIPVVLITRTAVLGVSALFGVWATIFRADPTVNHIVDAAVALVFAGFAYRAWRLYQRVFSAASSN
jgi:hypothetical protein